MQEWATGLGNILEAKLHLNAEQATDEWVPWEHKTWNMHRGVILWKPKSRIESASEIISQVRDQTRSIYKMSWWKGFAFGAIVILPEPPNDLEKLEEAIDIYNRPKGVWQWVILVTEDPHAALGIHTWIEGYLSLTCRDVMAHYERLGIKVGLFKKKKSGLMNFLTFVSSLKGHKFDEFRDPNSS